jgi:hypothetical protein
MKKYIVKKYILANSIHEVFKLEKSKKPDDILLDSDSEPKVEGTYAIGFDTSASDYYYSPHMKRKKKSRK